MCTPIRRALTFTLVSSGALLAGPPHDTDEDRPVTREEHDRVVRELADLKLGWQRRDREAADSGGAAPAPGLPGFRSDTLDKPFLQKARDSVSLGGYFDLEYRDPQNAPHEFRFHRLVPFIYADVHERVRFATEIEIEDGSDIGVEFAHVDVLLTDEVNLRGGVILDPLGKFNLIHDSPINDLTDRPLVNRFVIPTTLRELGVGVFGDLTPQNSDCEIQYEAYLTSGFKGLDSDGATTITSASGTRSARPHGTALGTSSFDDINNKFAGVGRLSISPIVGSELGISAHSGAYDEAGDNLLTTTAVDALVTIPELDIGEVPIGPIEIQGEGAYSFIERNSFARTSGVTDDIFGYYVQASYHFMPSFLVDYMPYGFWPGSTFTLVGRWDHVDLDGNRMSRATIGLNYRPIESTVIKVDFQLNDGSGAAAPSADDDAIVFSIASYF